ncbi:DUF1311 domain-containing protein [Seohaeicola saemankumensis]|nr:lysozyme inhibitor LprI family protein [Seohaeicola saemankumensis]MCA0869771.1 DUF1311 domain-containing protein [Seohaeicola saemankumensis]
MRMITRLLPLAVLAAPSVALADPTLECSQTTSSQVETGDCMAETEARVDGAVELALSFAMDAAKSLDEVTGRAVSAKALAEGQAAWTGYRDSHCDFVGTTMGGGSGTGIAIRACRIELGRARVRALMQAAQ